MIVSVLGTEYYIHYVDPKLDEFMNENHLGGYCDFPKQSIFIGFSCMIPGREMYTDEEHRGIEKKVLRHELIHAFLYESGLDSDSMPFDGSWARNEEMVDWIAMQGPKIIKAWQDADAL